MSTTTVNIDASAYVKKTELPSNLTLYPTNVPSAVVGYSLMVTDIEDPNYNDIAVNIPTGEITGTSQLIASLATTDGKLTGNPGQLNVTTIGNVRRISGTGTATFYYEIYLRTGAGVETLIGTSSNTAAVSLSTYSEFKADALFNNGNWLTTDKIVIKYYANRIAGGSNPSFEFQFGGIQPVRTIVPVPASVLVDLPITVGSTSVNNGTNGKLLNVTAGKVGEVTPDKTLVGLSNVDNTSDLNKPISTATQTALDLKQPTGNYATGGGTATGTNTGDETQTTIKNKLGAAASGVDGYLLGTDWTTFNGKQNALGFTPEDVANKQTDLTASATKYPTVNAVNTGLGTKQDTLISATNIKTVNGNTLLGSGDLVISGGGGAISVGTTPVTSGTVGRVFFQGTGDVVQQSSSLFWDNTNARLGVGATPATTVRLDVRAQGALSTDIAFRVRNSADTADIISFRGDGSEWIQSVPFRHAASLTGTNNTSQGLFLGYNVASLATTSTNAVIIGRGSGAILQGNGMTIIGDGFSHGTFSNSIGLGRGVVVNGSNQFVSGSQLYPTNTWLVSTGGEVTNGSFLRGLDFKVSGMAGGPSNISAATFPVRFFSPNGTGTGAGSNIQFHVAPSNTGGGAFFRNIFSEMFTIRGEADGLNHYQLATPRVPSASITDGYVQYSNDITAGNAAPHFRTENGGIIKLYQETTGVAAATLVGGGGTTITDTDTFAGYTLQQIAQALKNLGVLA